MGVDRQGTGSTGAVASAAAGRAMGEPISPELVLVDPELAHRARAALAQHDATLHRADSVPQHRARTELQQADQQDVGPPHAEVTPIRPLRPPRNRCVVPSLLSGLLGALIVALAISFKSTPGYYMPPVPSTDSGAATQPPATVAPATTSESAPNKPFRVSWKPERDAVGYEVALGRGSRTLYRAYSLQTSLEIPARWSFRGREYALDPGVYTWLVWPVGAAGKRDASPSTRRTLIVPGTGP